MERLGDEVERRLSQASGDPGAGLAALVAAWPGLVGAAIARNAWPLRVSRDGTLHVATSSATWAFELDRMSLELLERLREHLGERAPQKLSFRPGPVPEPGADDDERAPREAPEPSPETAAAAARAASAIEDPELRALVARAARASLGRGASGGRSDRGFW